VALVIRFFHVGGKSSNSAQQFIDVIRASEVIRRGRFKAVMRNGITHAGTANLLYDVECNIWRLDKYRDRVDLRRLEGDRVVFKHASGSLVAVEVKSAEEVARCALQFI